MSNANRIVGNGQDDLARHHRIWIKSGASSIRREVSCRTIACSDIEDIPFSLMGGLPFRIS